MRFIDEWAIVEDEQCGRIGRVFIVHRRDNPSRLFALKLLREDTPEKHDAALQHEIELLGDSNISRRRPQLIKQGTWNGLPYFVMEYVEGIDYPIADEKYRDFCVRTFTALGDLHTRDKLLHNDLTPRHIGQKDGRILFIDYDNACLIKKAHLNQNRIGTDPYIAPEVASQGKLSVQSDIYSLAMILLERCPKKQSDCFEPVLRKAIQPNAQDRPLSAYAVAEQLRTCRPPHHRFKAVVKWAGCVIIVFFLISLGVFLYRHAVIRKAVSQDLVTEAIFQAALTETRKGNISNAFERLQLIDDKQTPRSSQVNTLIRILTRHNGSLTQ